MSMSSALCSRFTEMFGSDPALRCGNTGKRPPFWEFRAVTAEPDTKENHSNRLAIAFLRCGCFQE